MMEGGENLCSSPLSPSLGTKQIVKSLGICAWLTLIFAPGSQLSRTLEGVVFSEIGLGLGVPLLAFSSAGVHPQRLQRALHTTPPFSYFINPMFISCQVVRTNQFSVTRHEKIANGLIGDQGLPGVFVLYELSPMMVKLTEKHRYGGVSIHFIHPAWEISGRPLHI